MYHYLYQIISLVPDENGVCKIYSGVRSSEVEPEIDDYFGSGRRLKAAVKKHGREKFIKTIVAKFDTREEAYACETQWLDKLFTKFYGSSWAKFNRHHYNLRLNENSRDSGYSSEDTRRKISEARLGTKASEETRTKLREQRGGELNPMFGLKGEAHPKFGIKMTDEQREAHSIRVSGELNPMFGKVGTMTGRVGEDHPAFGRTGIKNPLFEGLSVGTNRTTGQIIVFDGSKSMNARKFDSGHVSKVVLGKTPHHKNFTFIRTTDEDHLRQLLAEDNFFDEQSKTILQNFLQ